MNKDVPTPPLPSLHVNPSGQTSSHRAPHFDTVPVSFWRRLGQRCQLGDDKHGRGNRVLTYARPDGRYDIDALRDRYNHAIEHLLALHEGTAQDDHIGAVAWFLAYASEAEDHGVNWRDVLETRTPKGEAAYRDRCGIPVPVPEQVEIENKVELGPDRCAICGWPLAKNMAEGCVRGSCSQRPWPIIFYDPERAEREYGPVIHDKMPKYVRNDAWGPVKVETRMVDAGDRPITQAVAVTGRTGVVPCDLDGLNKPDLDTAAPRIIEGSDRVARSAANEGVLGCTGDPCVCQRGWGHKAGKPISMASPGEGEEWPQVVTRSHKGRA